MKYLELHAILENSVAVPYQAKPFISLLNLPQSGDLSLSLITSKPDLSAESPENPTNTLRITLSSQKLMHKPECQLINL